MSQATKIAALDVDGTLGPGALGVDLLRALMEQELCDRVAAHEVLGTLAAFGAGAIDFSAMATRAYAAYATALAGRECARVELVARELWVERRAQLFAFVPALLACLRAQSYEIMLISGSPIEMVACVAESLAIPAAYGAVFSRAEGRYTGAVDLSSGVPGQKAEIFAAATRGRTLELERCFALGDSMTDVALFERVGLPLAFEPSSTLASLAAERGWAVTTRDEVVAQTRALVGNSSAPTSIPVSPTEPPKVISC